jgi:rsbT co-antagonist protein RsbR
MDRLAMLEALLATIPGVVWETRGQGDLLHDQSTFVSDYIETMTGYTPEEWLAEPQITLRITHPDDRERVLWQAQEHQVEGAGTTQFRWIVKDGRTIWVESHMRVLEDEAGRPCGARGVTVDISTRKMVEVQHAALQGEFLQGQAATLEELTMPIIPITPEVAVMPLIGAIDAGRAERMISTLLGGIGRMRAKVMIIDITGVPGMDARIADMLVRAAKSVRLLGVEVMLTGVRPEIAKDLVRLGADLSHLVTRGTLESGIACALRRHARPLG